MQLLAVRRGRRATYGVLCMWALCSRRCSSAILRGTAPIVSYHFGADNKDELKTCCAKCGIIAVAVAMLTSSELLAEPLAKIFVGYDAGSLALTTHGMKLYCISFIPSGFQHLRLGVLHGAEQRHMSAAISFLRTLLFQVVVHPDPSLIIGVDGIWFAVVAAEAMALVCTGAFGGEGRKRCWAFVNKRGAKGVLFASLPSRPAAGA